MADPYFHHPELRGKIDDPESSFLRQLTNDFLWQLCEEHNLPGGWWYEDEERDALRALAMEGRWDRDLWVFGYGSLMWDPGFRFVEVRRARIEDFHRRFILLEDHGGRGNKDAPGLMAALDHGKSCDGLAFRIVQSELKEETRVLWQREQIEAGYIPTFVSTWTEQGEVEALTFVADHDADAIVSDIPRELQIEYLATSEGIMGTSADYLRNIVEKLAQLGIQDEDTSLLLRDVERRIAQG